MKDGEYARYCNSIIEKMRELYPFEAARCIALVHQELDE